MPPCVGVLSVAPARASQTETGGVGVIAYTVQQVAELVGVSARTVRYYEAEGLLIPAERTAGQHRRFGVGDVLDLVRVRRMASLGLTLEQIKTILDSPGSDAGEEVAAQLSQSLDRELASLVNKRRALEVLTSRGAPLDSLPEFAEQLAELREVCTTPEQVNLPRAMVELTAAIASEESKARMQRLVTDTNRDDELELERLISCLDDSSGPGQVAAVGQAWGHQLLVLYNSNEDYRRYVEDAPLRAGVQDLFQQTLNDAQLRARAIAQEMLAAHRHQLAQQVEDSAP